ncbi:MAG TPA: glycosyltransferase family 9 protein [Nitrospira sp.]|nr:glycosyltransferase family 9 protein [Nitrospira sp.]
MNILLARPDGIGDEILCLPVAGALRQAKPQARIMFLSSEYAAPVLQHHPDIDEILTVSGNESLRDLVALFQRNIDAVVFLKPFRRLMWAAWLARVPLRVATGYRLYSILANRRIYEHRSDFSKHESVYNVQMLKGLGIDPPAGPAPTLVVTEEERQNARRRLSAVPTPRVVLHPGGFAARTWRREHYWELAEALRACGFGVVFTGSRTEEAHFSCSTAAKSSLPEGMVSLMGVATLRESMAVIAESEAVVSGATGPAHIAAACGVPNVSLFDPRRNNLPTRWQPLGTGIVLRPDVPTCEKCVYEACPYWDCLDRITVERVVQQVKEVTARSFPLRVVAV